MLTQIAAGRVYDYSHSVGRGAQSGMGFSQPVAIALGKDDVVYVVNRGSESIGNVAWNRTGIGARVSKITVGTASGDEEFIGEFGKYGSGNGEYIWGSGIVVDRQGNVYVSDEWLNQVSVFDKDSKFLKKWSALERDDGQPHAASNIAMDADDNIYVTDGRSHEVRKFTRDGKFLTKWGRYGSDNGEFNGPWGIAVDQQGNVYVADHRNHRVQKFNSNGEWVAQFGSPGTGRGRLHLPVDVAVDPEGDVYICDWSDNGFYPGRVHIFDQEGKFLISLVGDAQQLSKWAQMTVDANADYLKRRREVPTTEPEWRFAVPTGVTYDPEKERLIVVDNQRSRLQIYSKVRDYMVPQMNL
jgi:DNA-binding beta-propeller fold protein YncE